MIAAYGDHVVMKDTLTDALAALFAEPGAVRAVQRKGRDAACGRGGNQAQQALDRYNPAVERLKAGDWKDFGTQFDALRDILEKMNRPAAGH